MAFAPPKATSINAAARANDEFEYLIPYPFIRVGESTDPAALGSESPKRKVGIALFGPGRSRNSLLRSLSVRNKVAGNLTNEIEKLLTGFDLGG